CSPAGHGSTLPTARREGHAGKALRVPARFSDRADLLGPRALGALGDGVLDSLAVPEAAVAVSLDGGLVEEDVRRAVVGADDPMALSPHDPLPCSLSHCALLPRRSSGSTGCIPGCGDRLSFRGWLGKSTAPAVRIPQTL